MTIADIIQELDAEIARLQQVRALLSNARISGAANLNSLRDGRRKRVLSAEAREKIAAAQRKRWAAQKRAAK
jgi:hypothetical protein